jgi:tRNA threonylcarbamoyladenosine biosynthesis protein TsaE
MAAVSVYVEGDDAMVAFGQRLGRAMTRGIILLRGDLGAGKTTLCRGIIRSRGHQGAVKSPTYTLVEPYSFPDGDVYHFDLYRLRDPEELEYMGIRDYFRPQHLCILEWPERGAGFLPPADILVEITGEGAGRKLVVTAQSALGGAVLDRIGNGTDIS